MVTVAAFTTPTGVLTPVLNNTTYNAPFTVAATFTPDTVGGSCAALVYRQNVRGVLTINTVAVNFAVCASSGTMLDPLIFREDGCPPSGSPVSCAGCTAYGYRACTMSHDRYTTPNQATGCQFSLEDAPGFTNMQPATAYGIDVVFQGQIVNVTGPTVVQSQEWRVRGAATLPPAPHTLAAAGPTALTHGEKPLEIRLAETATGERVLIFSLTRLAGAPPFNPAAIDLDLKSADGATVEPGRPTAHEVGNSRASTVHVFYPLEDGPLPTHSTVTLGGRALGEMPVRLT